MKRILLVDDEPHVLSALKRVLRARFAGEASIEVQADPTVALARVRETAFDVVVSDFRMPQMSGIEFLNQVRELQPHAVRLILSASYEFETIQRAVNEAEVFRYMAKPWSDVDVVVQIGAALEKAELTRQERQLADDMRVQRGALTPAEHERRRLEALEPGITRVEWGPGGEVLMPDDLINTLDLAVATSRGGP
jgi:two-component system probable response regulator PhcQ